MSVKYIVKVGYVWGIHIFFLFLLLNIDCGEEVLTCTHNLCFGKKIKIFQLKYSISKA